jgi:hypothetical protein
MDRWSSEQLTEYVRGRNDARKGVELDERASLYWLLGWCEYTLLKYSSWARARQAALQ